MNRKTGLVPWVEKVYPARLRNLSGSPSAHSINSYALPDKLSPSKALTCYSLYNGFAFWSNSSGS